MSHFISFPGLGITPFALDPVAFSVGPRDVMWYGVIICAGMILAVLYGGSRAVKEGLRADDFYDMVLWAVPIGIVCARLYYVIFDPEPNYHSFLDVIAIWRGGIGIYGGIIGGALTVILFAKAKKIPMGKCLDIAAPCVMIGQIVGRWGNFVNAEAHGGVTDLPWRMGIAYAENGPWQYVHPTFFYESLWNLVGFCLLHFLVTRHKVYEGQIFCFYAAWYGLGRGFIELLRSDSLIIGGLKVSALVGFLSFILFGSLYVIGCVKAKEKQSGSTH